MESKPNVMSRCERNYKDIVPIIKLLKNGQNDRKTLDSLTEFLNNTLPKTPEELQLAQGLGLLYQYGAKDLMIFISKIQLNCLAFFVCDPSAIISTFKLRGLCHIKFDSEGWNKKTNLAPYMVDIYNPPEVSKFNSHRKYRVPRGHIKRRTSVINSDTSSLINVMIKEGIEKSNDKTIRYELEHCKLDDLIDT